MQKLHKKKSSIKFNFWDRKKTQLLSYNCLYLIWLDAVINKSAFKFVGETSTLYSLLGESSAASKMSHYKSTLLSLTLTHDSAYIIVCMPQLTITIQYIKIHPNVSFGCINVRRLGSTEDILWSSGNYYNVKLF